MKQDEYRSVNLSVSEYKFTVLLIFLLMQYSQSTGDVAE